MKYGHHVSVSCHPISVAIRPPLDADVLAVVVYDENQKSWDGNKDGEDFDDLWRPSCHPIYIG